MFHWPTRVTWAWPNCKRGNEYGVELSAVSTTPRDQRSIPGSCVKGHTRLGRFLTWNCRNGAKNLPSQHDSSYPSQILPGLLDFFFFLIALIWHSLQSAYFLLVIYCLSLPAAVWAEQGSLFWSLINAKSLEQSMAQSDCSTNPWWMYE